ncbi:DUF402 domain-containing protein [Saccharopolyspora terrae]|uniref:DUF402 domain-containing protein n=1 Tax=Saccharopolyspora terrae TaxID=2530384 RepID=A0A4R4VND5_9PSEU|nr:DUF402 domain-containing protein [Saccharopolyspora terrae]TDD03755.1 DUF402 domain-containing protein [Saccharopolyspora terrae]
MTTQREIAERLGLPVHPPKTEVFDLSAGTNTDPKGHVRTVSRFRREPFGLYLARPLPGQPKIAALESWLLPSLGLRVTRWYWRPGFERDLDYYLDLVDVESSDTQWRTVDHYLDLEVRQGRGVELLDVDEFVLAVQSGLLEPETAERAMRRATAALEGITRCGYDLPKWLRTNDIELSWSGQPTQDPVPGPRSLPPAE